jgi:hydrogenase maturation protease
MEPIRVVGVGSPHGDDALGWEVVRQLRERNPAAHGIEFLQVDGGQRLLDLLDGRGTLILIDAMVDSGPSGRIERLEWPDRRLEVLAPGSTHALTPAEALQLAAALGVLPPHVVILGITCNPPEIGNQTLDLSSCIASAIPAALEQIEREIHRLTGAALAG